MSLANDAVGYMLYLKKMIYTRFRKIAKSDC